MHDENSPTRIASYIVSGLGFLGGGVILRDGLNVKGLNTAATLWCSGGSAPLPEPAFRFKLSLALPRSWWSTWPCGPLSPGSRRGKRQRLTWSDSTACAWSATWPMTPRCAVLLGILAVTPSSASKGWPPKTLKTRAWRFPPIFSPWSQRPGHGRNRRAGSIEPEVRAVSWRRTPA